MKAKKFLITVASVVVGASILLTGCGAPKADAKLITIENTSDSISYGCGNFMARYQQSMYDMYMLSYYGEGMWSTDMSGQGKTLQEETKEGVISDLEEMYLCKKHAADYDVQISDDEKKEMQKAAKKFIKANDEKTVELMTADESTIVEYLEYKTYQSRVEKAAKVAANVEISDEECWQRTFSYVFFDTVNAKPEEGADLQAAPEPLSKKEVKKIKKQAADFVASGDFDQSCEDNGLEPMTYSYSKGEEVDANFDMAVIEAAEKLKKGQMSSTIEVEGKGIYVIRLDSEHDKDASEETRESMKTKAENDAYSALLEEWKKDVEFTVDEKLWDKVQFATLFKAVEQPAENADEGSAQK